MVRPTYSGPCEATRDLILKKQVEALTSQEAAFLAGHLAECGSCRSLAGGIDGITSGLEALGRIDFTPRMELRDAVLSHVRALKTGRRPSRILRAASSRRPRHISSARRPGVRIWARLVVAAAVAAAVLAAVGIWRRPSGGSATRPAPESHTRVAFIRGKGQVELLRGGRRVALRAGERVLDGDRLRTDSDVQLALFFRDGSTAVLNSGTELAVVRAEGQKFVELRSGNIFVAVEKRSGQYFAVNQGQSDQVLVTGTSFELSRSAEGTQLNVAAGSVKFGLGKRAIAVTTRLSSMVGKGSPAPTDPEPLAADAEVAAWRTKAPPPTEDPNVIIAPLPEAPVPSVMALPTSGSAPLTVSFDASGSRAEEGPPAFSWDFGDGERGAGAKVEHRYGKPGRYVARLTVTDARGRAAFAEVTIRVVEGKSKTSSRKKSSGSQDGDADEGSGGEAITRSKADPGKGKDKDKDGKETGKPTAGVAARDKHEPGKDDPPGQSKSTVGKKKRPRKKSSKKKPAKSTGKPPKTK
jgi:PKD repeat protein